MEKKSRKEMQAQYREREVIGGVCAIRNTLRNKALIEAATDIQGSRNRFEFAMKTGSCVHPKLQGDWAEQSGANFAFETLEELKKADGQSAKEFEADIEVLRQIWLEKLAGEYLY